MALRTPVVVSVTLLALSASFAAQAQTSPMTGDPKRGHALSYTCNGCHAIPNYKNVYPTYSVPKLRRQRPEYLVSALKAYKSGERSHGTMHSQASTMSEQDMWDIAVYLAGPEVLTKSENDPSLKSPEHRPSVTDTCIACHGTNGVGITADYPSLAGQHKDYLVRALTDYKKGGRKNPIMGGQVASLTPEDIKAAAEFFSTRDPSLEPVQVNRFFFSSTDQPAK